MLKRLFTVFLLISVLYAPLAFAQFDSATFNQNTGPLTITRITPAGEDVAEDRQIVFKFNQPVVPVGRMERSQEEIPIKITPSLNGEWRWLNTSTLALQLGEQEKLKKSMVYTINIEPKFVTVNGNKMEKGMTHTFTTLRPRIQFTYFSRWRGPGHPVVGISANQPISVDSLLSKIYFTTADEKTVIPAKLYMEAGYDIEPAEELPLDTLIHLKVNPGIVSLEGPELGVEKRTVVTFMTFPEFEFLGISGLDNDDREVFLSPDGHEKTLLSPLKNVALLFSSPVPAREEGPKLQFVPDLLGGRTDYNPWVTDNDREEYYYNYPHQKGNKYKVYLPEKLKSAQAYSLKSTQDFQDIFGRSLKKQMDLTFNTSHRPPSIFLKNRISVLEKNVETHVPLVVDNLNQLNVNYRLLSNPSDFWLLKDFATCAGVFNANQQAVFPVDLVDDVAYQYPFKAREVLQGKSGALAGFLTSVPKAKSECPIKFFTQVTNLAVHVKLGHHNTMVWVTRLDTGEPVAGAQVELYVHRQDTPATLGKTDNQGVVVLKGTVDIDPYLEKFQKHLGCSFGVIKVYTKDDSALMPLYSDFMVNVGYYNDGYYYANNLVKYSHMQAWGTTGQGVYRAGDTIDYKIYVRDQNNRRFCQPEMSTYSLQVKDPAGKVVYEQNNITLSRFGSLHGSFTISKEAVSGWYAFYLKANFGKNPQWEPMRVLVTDFTPAPFKVQTEFKGQFFKFGDRVAVETTARLHGGGPYGNANTRITAILRPSYFNVANPELKKYYFYPYGGGEERQILQQETELDEKGDTETSFELRDSGIIMGKLMVESAVRDDRGKYVSATATVPYVGRDRLVGVYFKDWVLEEDQESEFKVVVVDEKGNPTAGTEMDVKVEYERVTGSRVKGAGNAYLMEYNRTMEEVQRYTLVSQSQPLSCKFVPQEPGIYNITAVIKDTYGNSHSTCLSKYVTGKGQVLWDMPNDNSLSIIPEQEEYNVGQKARFMVRNPYPGAKALITIERLGIMKKWVETFNTNTPIIEFDIEPDFVPGFYLSVVVNSPRVDKPLEDGNVDLGKPAFRMGYLQVNVNDPYKRLSVSGHTDKEVYNPREDVTLNINVSDINKNRPETEVAVVVLDEAVLDLIHGGKDYFDPYKGFYHLGGLDVENYNILMQLLGRQKFEKKGANSGGCGGLSPEMRNLFKFVAYWNPEIHPDDNGEATVSFKLPDNLTGWRVLVLAVTKDDLMGLGETRFATNKPTEIRPAIPNQVCEGDSFKAVFTVMNRTDRPRNLTVHMVAEGETKSEPLTTNILAEPYVRNKVYLPVKVNKSGEVTFKVSAGDKLDQDGIVVKLTVHKKQAMEAAATYGTTTQDTVSENFEFPKNMRTDMGKVSVVVSPSIVGALEGVFKYMRNYPYMCWEQRLSKGVMGMHYLNLRQYLAKSLEWPEARDYVLKMLADAPSFQAPNGGMCYYTPQDDYADPYLSAYTAIAFNWLKESGYTPPPQVESALHNYLLNMLRRDVFPSFFSKGMSSTVRAVSLAALAQNGKITKGDLDRYLSHVQYMDLFGKAHYLLAATYVSGTAEIQTKVYDMIMSQANETGGKLIFSDTIDRQGFERILASDIRTNAAVLRAILAIEEGPQHLFKSTDTAFKMVRYLTQSRKSRDHWENTQENIFCMHALTVFSKLYDNVAPKYTVSASMDSKEFGRAEFSDLRDAPEELLRPVKKDDPGRKAKLELNKKGPGRLYYGARLFYSPKELKVNGINSGIEVHREYYVERDGQWIFLDENHMQLKQGELVRVELFVSLPAARNFVVVADPVPGGLEPVNRDLATSSTVDADKATGTYSGSSWWHKHDDWLAYGYSHWSFYHKELLHHAARFYSEYLPAGNYHLSYTAQAIAPGEFFVMPLHAEEMYDPDVFGQGVPAMLHVEEGR